MFPRRAGMVLSGAFALIGIHVFLLGVALDWRADYLKAVSGFSTLWTVVLLALYICDPLSKKMRR
jgi:hypothetical protein